MNYPTAIIIGAALLAGTILSSDEKEVDAALSGG